LHVSSNGSYNQFIIIICNYFSFGKFSGDNLNSLVDLISFNLSSYTLLCGTLQVGYMQLVSLSYILMSRLSTKFLHTFKVKIYHLHENPSLRNVSSWEWGLSSVLWCATFSVNHQWLF